MKYLCNVLFILFFTNYLYAQDTKADGKLFIVDVRKNEPQRVLDSKKNPRRVYAFFEKNLLDKGSWVFMMTDSDGNFASPKEILLAGSVLSAPLLGDVVSKKMYQLKLDGSWTETQSNELYRLWVSEPNSYLKTVQFLRMASLPAPPPN